MEAGITAEQIEQKRLDKLLGKKNVSKEVVVVRILHVDKEAAAQREENVTRLIREKGSSKDSSSSTLDLSSVSLDVIDALYESVTFAEVFTMNSWKLKKTWRTWRSNAGG